VPKLRPQMFPNAIKPEVRGRPLGSIDRGKAELLAIRPLVAAGIVELKQHLTRVDQALDKQSRELAAMREDLARVLKHQTSLGRAVGRIETAPLRHTRRRPLGVV